jgi:hypothetical protein
MEEQLSKRGGIQLSNLADLVKENAEKEDNELVKLRSQ